MVLVERDDQLYRLSELFHRSRAGQGQVILLTGPVACGKTALLTAFDENVAAAGGRLIRAVGSRNEKNHKFGVAEQLFQTAQVPPEMTERASVLLRTDYQAHMEAFHDIFDMLLELAAERPLVVAVDDIDHADAASLECVTYLARRLGSARLTLVLTETPFLAAPYPRIRAELLRQPFCSEIPVPPLSAEGVAQLMRAQFGESGASDLARQCFQIVGGNPLLTRAIIADNAVPAQGVSGSAVLRIGDNFRRAVEECLYRHDDVGRRVAHGLAVVTESSAKPAVVSELLDIPLELLARASRLLAASGLLTDGLFRHPSIQRAIADDMRPGDLRRLHMRSAEVLYRDGAASSTIAAHLVKARSSTELWAGPVLRAAAERALLTGDSEFASDCLRLADGAETDPRERAATTVMLVKAQWQVNPLAVGRHLGALTEAARGDRLSPQEMLTIAPYMLWHGRTYDAADLVSRVARAQDQLDIHAAAQRRAVQLLASWGPAEPLMTGDDDSCGGRAAAGQPPAGAPGSVNPLLQAVTVLGQALTRPAGAGVFSAEQILQRCELEEAASGPAAAALGALICAGRSDRAVIWSEVFLHHPSLRNAPTWHAILRAIRAEAALRVADLVGAEDHARAALAAMPAQAWGIGIGLPLAVILLAATETGNLEEASRSLAVPVPVAMSHTPMGLLYLRARGRYYLATGRYQAAMGDFQSCAEVMEDRRFGHPVLVPWRLELARAQICLGDAAAAAALAREQLDTADELDVRTRGLVLRLLAAAAVPHKRIVLLKQAVDILQECDDRVELAHALADLGRALDAQGDVGRARMMITRAYRLADGCGARLLCDSLLLDKPAIGPAELSSAASDDVVDRLSDAERRVASLAAQGRSNREIAGKLFITVSTVEQHLTRVYKKLKIKRRIDLPIGLAEHADPWVPAAHALVHAPPDPPAAPARWTTPMRRPVRVSYGGRA